MESGKMTSSATMIWVNHMIRYGYVCKGGTEKLKYVNSKYDLFRILCDAGSLEFIPKLMIANKDIPFDDFKDEFKNLINGQRIMEYDGYTSSFFLDFNGEFVANSTIVSIIRSECTCTIKDGDYVTLVISPQSNVEVDLKGNAKVIIEAYGNAKYRHNGTNSNVKIKHTYGRFL